MKKTHNCGELRAANKGQTVVLKGWADTRRDHGGLIFIDLRDRRGLTQIAVNPAVSEAALKIAHEVRHEFVLEVTGKVASRPDGTVNKNLPTGEIEILADAIKILNKSKTPPFPMHGAEDATEALRLKYRYLDLRRPEMRDKILLRSAIVRNIRGYLDGHGFLDIETPILTKSTPEGARDYLVPSRLYAGKFFALPQSPLRKRVQLAGISNGRMTCLLVLQQSKNAPATTFQSPSLMAFTSASLPSPLRRSPYDGSSSVIEGLSASFAGMN